MQSRSWTRIPLNSANNLADENASMKTRHFVQVLVKKHSKFLAVLFGRSERFGGNSLPWSTPGLRLNSAKVGSSLLSIRVVCRFFMCLGASRRQWCQLNKFRCYPQQLDSSSDFCVFYFFSQRGRKTSSEPSETSPQYLRPFSIAMFDYRSVFERFKIPCFPISWNTCLLTSFPIQCIVTISNKLAIK